MLRGRVTKFFEHIWYGSSLLSALFVPFAWIYSVLLRIFRRRALVNREKLNVPIIVVGNLTVGGTGKTPVVIWLVEQLRKLGYRPGVVTRGYRGTATASPIFVSAEDSASAAGDEAVLLARRLRCPVVAGADRVAATRSLMASATVDVVISDDGLQHFALDGDCEVIVIDGVRGLGNGRLLPAGPLREPSSRLADADAVLINGQGWTMPGALSFGLNCSKVVQLCDGAQKSLAEFAGSSVHAIAAIGNPQRFFDMLRDAGCVVDEYALPDHAAIPAEALVFGDAAPILITEKDAVKLPQPVSAGVWSVNVDVDMSSVSTTVLLEKIIARIGRVAASQ